MYHGSSLATCLGGNITSPLGWTSWSTTAVAARVWVTWGIVADWEFLADVHVAFEVCGSLMETVCLHAVFDAQQGFVFLLNFGHNGLAVDFKLGSLLVVAAVSFYLGVCSGVLEAIGHFSQSVVGPSFGLE